MVGGKSTCVLSFKQKVPAREALSVSEDGRFAISSSSVIFILDFVNKPMSTLGSKFTIRLLSPDITVLRFDVGIAREILTKTISKQLSKGDLEVLGLDVSLRQSLWTDAKHEIYYKAAKWSPQALSDRCVLATLSSDHRTCLHIQIDEMSEKWTMVSDLSVLYNEHKLNEWPELTPDKITITQLQDRIHSMAAIDIAWSRLYSCSDIPSHSNTNESSQDAFCLLAIAMRSGHVTLWKVLSNVRSSADVKLLSVLEACTADPECIQWCPYTHADTGLLAIGGVQGEIVLFQIRISDEIQVVKVMTLCDDLDQLTVSCLTWSKQGAMLYLLANKEVFIMGYGLEKKGDNYVSVMQTHTRGQHSLQATAFLCNSQGESSKILLASGDGCLQTVTVNEKNGNEMEILTECIEMGLDLQRRWKIHGLSITHSNIFTVFVASPTSKFDHLAFREPYEVHCITLVDMEKECETLLLKVLSFDGQFEKIADIMEILRQHYCQGKAFPEFFTQMMEASDKWPLLSSKQLKIIRYLSMTKLSIYQTSKGNKSEKVLMSLQKNVATLTDLILTKHAQSVIKFLQGEAILLRQNERKCLRVLCEKVKKGNNDIGPQSLTETGPQSLTETGPQSLTETIWLKFDLDQSERDCCDICGEEFLPVMENSVRCSNGHQFGCCCISLLSCQTVPYRKCVICGALALQQQHLKDFPWLSPASLTMCTLCGGKVS